MAKQYIRQSVEEFIIKALQSLGGSASKKAIKEEIVADDSYDISYENVFEPILSRNGTAYIPFNLDFNFGLINLHTCGYVEDYGRCGDVTLTEMGRMANYAGFPSEEVKEKIRKYWEKKDQERAERKRNRQTPIDSENKGVSDTSAEIIAVEDNDSSEGWRVTVLEQIKQFSPKKFENFSRLLFRHRQKLCMAAIL